MGRAAQVRLYGGISPPFAGEPRSPSGAQKNFASLIAEAIPEHARAKPIHLWWQDEARVGQKGRLAYVWARKGSRSAAILDQRHDFAYILGALCPARDLGVGLIVPEVSNEAMTTIERAQQYQPAAPAPYSPKLNPVENIWQFLRHNFLAHSFFETYDAIAEACCNA